MKADGIEAPDEVADLFELIGPAGVGGRGRRSPLTRWMWAHYDEFAVKLAANEPNWEVVASGLAAKGLCDGRGEPPTAARVRKTWWSVQKMKAAAAAKRAARVHAPVLATGEIAFGVRVPALNHGALGQVPTQVTRNPTPASSPAHASTANPAMKRLDDQMRARSSPMSLPVRR